MENNKIIKIITNILIITILIITIFISYTYINLKVLKKDYPNIFGYTFFEVTTGSMSPAIKKNDIIIVKLNTKYQKNDIVTFKSSKSYVTHRIIDKSNKNVITKGDANNTKDKIMNINKIIGRVVLTIPKAGRLKKIILSPLVLSLLIITAITTNITYSYTPKAKTKSKSNILSIIKEIDIKKLIDSVKVDFLIIIILILVNIIPITISRYESTGVGNTTTNIAFYLLNKDYQTNNIKLTTLAPSNTPYVYRFSVSNFTPTKTSEVDIEYVLKIVTTTNLPLTFKLYKNEDYTNNSSTNLVTNNNTVVTADSDGTYFKYITCAKETMLYTQTKTNNYTLLVYYNEENADEMYQNTIESIRIILDSNQIVDN